MGGTKGARIHVLHLDSSGETHRDCGEIHNQAYLEALWTKEGTFYKTTTYAQVPEEEGMG